jgi:hypothetical protein
MLVTGIKSKPVYTPLASDLSGRYHLMVGHGVGSEPLLRVLRDLRTAAPESGARTRVLFVGNPDEQAASGAQFHSAGAADVRLFGREDESFMGLVMRIARQFNLNKDEVRAEECGSSARRVYCIHCQTSIENVTTNIVQCKDCDRWLLVRDHYSSRLAAYMGVMVDAEAPGERPDMKEVFR